MIGLFQNHRWFTLNLSGGATDRTIHATHRTIKNISSSGDSLQNSSLLPCDMKSPFLERQSRISNDNIFQSMLNTSLSTLKSAFPINIHFSLFYKRSFNPRTLRATSLRFSPHKIETASG
jgi:hypothetical protein